LGPTVARSSTSASPTRCRLPHPPRPPHLPCPARPTRPLPLPCPPCPLAFPLCPPSPPPAPRRTSTQPASSIPRRAVSNDVGASALRRCADSPRAGMRRLDGGRWPSCGRWWPPTRAGASSSRASTRSRSRPGPTGRLSALSVFHSRSCGAFVWARRALNGPKRRLPARGQSTEAVRLARLYAFHGADAVRRGIGIGVH
jgi:hypothetical protein